MTLATLLPVGPASADDPAGRTTAVATSSRQATTCHLADGRSVPCTVRSHLVVLEDGAARGQARLEHEGPDGDTLVVEIAYVAARLVRTEEGSTALFQGKGEVCTSWDGCRLLEDLQAKVGPSPASGGILIYDIQDGFVYGTTFEATGNLTVLEVGAKEAPGNEDPSERRAR